MNKINILLLFLLANSHVEEFQGQELQIGDTCRKVHVSLIFLLKSFKLLKTVLKGMWAERQNFFASQVRLHLLRFPKSHEATLIFFSAKQLVLNAFPSLEPFSNTGKISLDSFFPKLCRRESNSPFSDQTKISF